MKRIVLLGGGSRGDPISALIDTSVDLALAGRARDFGSTELSEADAVAVATDSPAERLELIERALSKGYEVPALVHPTAFISPTARIGAGTQVSALACLGPDTVVGSGTIIAAAVVLSHDVRIGNGASIDLGTVLAGRCKIGDLAVLEPRVTAIPDVAVGAGARVAAGSVLIRAVAAGASVAGVPAN